jgi:putative tryptophan/tyrosine transport system substrate-binding protein
MRRRTFIAGLGSAAAWPVMARAQQGDRVRRIGVLMSRVATDTDSQSRLTAFIEALRQLGWADGSNLRMEVRWGGDNVDQMRTLAKELVDLRPEVILADTTPATVALQPVTRTIPIVFVLVSDPVGDGFVESLSRPGGNITGFGNFEASIAGRWLELLTEIVPGLRRAAIMFNPDTAAGGGSYFLPSFEAAAQSLKVEPNAAPVRSDAEIESVISSLGRKPGSGLVVMPDSFMAVHRALIIMLAARDNVPAVYSSNVWSRDGGLLSYGADQADVYRRAAPYVDRILRGAKRRPNS